MPVYPKALLSAAVLLMLLGAKISRPLKEAVMKLHLHPQQPVEGASKLPGYWLFLYYKLPKTQGR